MKRIILDSNDIKKILVYYDSTVYDTYTVKLIPERSLFFGLLKFKKKLIITYKGVWKNVYYGDKVDEILSSDEIVSPIEDKGHIEKDSDGNLVFVVHPHLIIFYKNYDGIINSTIFDTVGRLRLIVQDLLSKLDKVVVIDVQND